MDFLLHSVEYKICSLQPKSEIPAWARNADQFSVVIFHPHEITVVCNQADVPSSVKSEGPWRCLEIKGPLSFELVGILSGVLELLASCGIGVLAYSTFDTDTVFVPSDRLQDAIDVLRDNGHKVDG